MKRRFISFVLAMVIAVSALAGSVFAEGFNGTVKETTYNGNFGWYYVVDGKVQSNYTGVANYSNDYGWWYIRNGKVDFSYTGLACNDYGWWFVDHGKVDFSHCGIDQNQWGWWYVVNGKVQFNYTGVGNYCNPYGWWYIKNGQVDFSYNGTAKNKYGTWNVVNGKVKFDNETKSSATAVSATNTSNGDFPIEAYSENGQYLAYLIKKPSISING